MKSKTENQQIKSAKSRFFEEINTIDMSLARLTKKKKKVDTN